MSLAGQVESLRQERQRLKQRRNDLARRSLGCDIGLKASGSDFYQIAREIDQQIEVLEHKIEAAGGKIPFWE